MMVLNMLTLSNILDELTWLAIVLDLKKYSSLG